MNLPLSTRVRRTRHGATAGLLAAALLLTACGGTGEESTTATTTDVVEATTDDATAPAPEEGDGAAASAEPIASTSAVDVGLFFDGALAEDAVTEDCTLSGGVETTCYRLTVSGYPTSYEVGPFCPDTIDAGPEDGGLWWDGEEIYDLDGEFITNLAEIYGDENWLLYDEDGNVNVTETAEEFDGAARPDVDPSLQNHCVEGRLEWLTDGEPITSEILIPVEPVLADTPGATNGNLGVTLDGVLIAQSAPVDAILGAYTIAAFDDCGAHFNPAEGYHLHGAVGCSELETSEDGDTPMFGYAMDGVPVHSPLDDAATADLDECNGHTTEAAGYHYHANAAAENLVIECLIGQVVAGAEGAGGPPGGGPPGGGAPGQ